MTIHLRSVTLGMAAANALTWLWGWSVGQEEVMQWALGGIIGAMLGTIVLTLTGRD